MRGKETIIFGYIVFFLVISQLTAMGAPTVFNDVLTNPDDYICEPDGIFGSLRCVWQNMGIFFDLMKVGTEWAMLSAAMVIPFVIMVAWVVLRLLIDLINAIVPG